LPVGAFRFFAGRFIRFSCHKNENGQPALIADCPKNEFLKMLRALRVLRYNLL
jgi:hypothetical protein